jgi:hypothetical protein
MPASFFFSIASQYDLKTCVSVGALFVVCSGVGVVAATGLFAGAFVEFALAVFMFEVFVFASPPPHAAKPTTNENAEVMIANLRFILFLLS